jgi:hypothetical protein
MGIRCRDFSRSHGTFHPHVSVVPAGQLIRGGGLRMVQLGGPAGPVSSAAGDLAYTGMDPSDPSTYVRPYAPQAGMIDRLNFDPFLSGQAVGPRDLRYWGNS